MTGEDFKQVLDTTGFPVAYFQFLEPQHRPYIVYACDSSNDMMADNIHYKEVVTGYVELYTDYKDEESERKVKLALLNNHIAFMKETEGFIKSEEVFYVRWSFSFI